VVSTDVQFKTLTPAELAWYVECGEWSGAAGAYRIQERGAFFVEWIRGSYSNVVGLPLEAFYGILIRNEYHF
jgi:septum formation protein